MDKIRSKYLDEYKEKPKKKVKVKKYIGAGLRIVDTDSTLAPVRKVSQLPQDDEGPNIVMDDPEELPQVVAVVDDRPAELKLIEQFRQSNKWKTVHNDEDDSTINPDSLRNSAKSTKKSTSESHRRQRYQDSDESPPRRSKGGGRSRQSDSDESPPRIRERNSNSSNNNRRKRNSDSDASPPRRRKQNSDSDASPPRRRRKNSDSDASPPRRRDDSNKSPPRRRQRSPDSDISPPRQRVRRGNDDNYNYSRQQRSPNQSSSSSRNPNQRDSRRDRERLDESPPPTHGNKQTKTLDGKKAGLQTAGALKNELEDFRRKENEKFNQMDESITGRYAKTKVRDRATGRERDMEAEMEKNKEEAQKAQERKDQYNKWGKGLKQIEEQQERVSSALHEMSKPLARLKDDEDLDAYLKQQDRDGDPMAKFLSKKRDKGSSSGPAKPKYQGPAPPPNRFNIPPGYRWDGVDRSNGYERQWFGKVNSRKALQEESYKWSVEDL